MHFCQFNGINLESLYCNASLSTPCCLIITWRKHFSGKAWLQPTTLPVVGEPQTCSILTLPPTHLEDENTAMARLGVWCWPGNLFILEMFFLCCFYLLLLLARDQNQDPGIFCCFCYCYLLSDDVRGLLTDATLTCRFPPGLTHRSTANTSWAWSITLWAPLHNVLTMLRHQKREKIASSGVPHTHWNETFTRHCTR